MCLLGGVFGLAWMYGFGTAFGFVLVGGFDCVFVWIWYCGGLQVILAHVLWCFCDLLMGFVLCGFGII